MKPSIPDLLRAVADAAGLSSPDALKSESRAGKLPDARAVAVLLVRRFRGMSYPELAELLAYRSASGAMAAHKRAELYCGELVEAVMTHVKAESKLRIDAGPWIPKCGDERRFVESLDLAGAFRKYARGTPGALPLETLIERARS